MRTPICDFVRSYQNSSSLRLHMPGHKGAGPLGAEAADITEIEGADSLYEANGIIAESEKNASRLFSSGHTFYSCEGSSLAIRAMLFLAAQHAKAQGLPPLILAGRNAHRVFTSACALLDLPVQWITAASDTYLTCRVTAQELEGRLSSHEDRPAAVYLTSPDYLGAMCDLPAIARVCHRHQVLLLVDNAHGAYLHFLQPSLHPLDAGADLCCDSAHKTLPALTGAAYLHLSPALPAGFAENARYALAMFGSTSPSYLILQSLDALNDYLSRDYEAELAGFCMRVSGLRSRLCQAGYQLYGDEPLKLTIQAKTYGYTGSALDSALAVKGVICEFSDPDWLVLMLTPGIGEKGLHRLEQALLSIPRQAPISIRPPEPGTPERVLSIRAAALAPQERIPAAQSEGRILGAAPVACPPAVPIVGCGERISAQAIKCFRYYGIPDVSVVQE